MSSPSQSLESADRVSYRQSDFDVIVVGAGHAGIEASLSSARLGASTALVTSNLARIGYMSCNPSIGGLAKGHMVREIDALGGEMGLAADATCIQFKRLNSRKGPAVRGSRAQCDKDLYVRHMTRVIQTTEGLSVVGSEAKELLLENGRCVGVRLEDGSAIRAKSVILTTGTFMRGVMHIGLTQVEGGRVGDKATVGISDQLREHGFLVQRLKTGTPARLRAGSIDFSKTTEQRGDEKFYPFSSRSSRDLGLPQVSCWLSHTNERTHDVIRANLDKSPMFCGHIEGRGPRYCPSIEDKITRFVDKISHQTFLEPEGLSTDSIYLQGISTSLPEDVQLEFLRTIQGLENVEVIRYGYAVEYDFIEPTQIRHSLETRSIPGLFLAGQINGTSGYEEAAAQGFIAGVNAVRSARAEEPFILGRDEAYTGVLIDDLVTKGTREPYRMFTSRAEHRMFLREDNTLERLWNRATELGIIGLEQESRLEAILEKRQVLRETLKSTVLVPNAETQSKLEAIGTAKLLKPTTAEELLRRHEISFEDLANFGVSTDADVLVTEPIEIDVKYAGYIERERETIQANRRLEGVRLPRNFDYLAVRGLSKEEQEKLGEKQPETLGQASRMSGVNPSAIQALIVHLKSLQSKSTGAAFRAPLTMGPETDLVSDVIEDETRGLYGQNQLEKKAALESLEDAGLPDPSRLKQWAPHLSDEELEICRTYMRELLRFNKTLNLVSPATAARVDAVHILDVLRTWALVEPKVPVGSEIYDFGTGNGLPGLLCAALSPDRKFRLIDRDQRKLEFCKHVAATLKLRNIVFSCMDVADLPPSSVHFAISRGFASVTKSLLLIRPVCAVGCRFFMMKGESWSLELSELPPRLFGVWSSEMIGQYGLPDTPAEFVVLQSRKITE